MKYKAKFNASTPSLVVVQNHENINIGDILTPNENNMSGVVVFIPFTDQRFFEPVKTRTFQVEVSEENMDRFDSLINDGFEPWTITEITENIYMEALKANPNVAPQVIDALRNTLYLERIVTAFQIIKEREGGRLYTVKGLNDYTKACANTISGLKNAKDIVDSWWNL